MTDMIDCPYCGRTMERRDFSVHRKAQGHRRPPLAERVPVRDWPSAKAAS